MSDSLPWKTYLYFCAQSINLTTAVMSVTMAAIVGAALAPVESLSTVPYGFQFLFVMLATYPASWLMKRAGRRKAFVFGSIPLVVSGCAGYWAVDQKNFIMLIISHSTLGIYIAFANFNRFAATDDVDVHIKPKVLSLVVAGGVLAAILGPLMTEFLRDVGGFELFSLCYAAFIGLALLSFTVAFCLPDDSSAGTSFKVPPDGLLTANAPPVASIRLAIIVAALGYGIMNLLMIQASMQMMHSHEDFSDIRSAIQWHVVAMFAPSFFTGQIIQKIGTHLTIAVGLAMLIVCSILNIMSDAYTVMILSLLVLGVGWNFTYVGGGALLAQSLENGFGSYNIQGKNDVVIAVCATIGAFSPALLLGVVGWDITNLICIILSTVLLIATAYLMRSSNHALGAPVESKNE